MNYYLEKISKTQKQFEIAKIGFIQLTNNYIQKVRDCQDGVDYTNAKDMVEALSAGLELIKELESQVTFLCNKYTEECEKEKSDANKN